MTITPSILGRVTTNLQEKTIVHCVVEKDLTLVKLKVCLFDLVNFRIGAIQ